MKFIDLTGETFGLLKVLYQAPNQGHHVMWHCMCECGNEKDVRGEHLRGQKIKSCGCLKKQSKFIDISNQHFGLLTVLRPNGVNSKREQLWECQCKCGTLITVSGSVLRSGRIFSCGCIKSKGEEKIASLLSNENILFEKQKTFNTRRFLDTKALAKFDFYVNNKYLIEYDGIQHFKASGNGWNTEENLQIVKQNDDFKNQWCKNNNIPLIRIPYTHLKDLCIEDLKLETSKFIFIDF